MAHQADRADQETVSAKIMHLEIAAPATNLDASHAKDTGAGFLTITSVYKNLGFHQISRLNNTRQLFSVRSDFSLIPIVNVRQVDTSSIMDYPSLPTDVSQDIHSQEFGRSSNANRLALVPMRKGNGNSGALSLEPFEMSGLNFQVSVEHIGTVSTGERKKD